MLHPSSIRFITFIVLLRQISKKRVEAVDIRVYTAASVATFKRLIYNFDNHL
ncbi:hypothetical protein T03_16180 [Trichinella britovi]|uniref:Uncharacterized protein n=1 Tax=Trichinella britovi TaxID=45882 RepID=A0A0V1BTB9_TRIBR|nr:hypothetical protein T03_16180 [Trichinella britovi]